MLLWGKDICLGRLIVLKLGLSLDLWRSVAGEGSQRGSREVGKG